MSMFEKQQILFKAVGLVRIVLHDSSFFFVFVHICIICPFLLSDFIIFEFPLSIHQWIYLWHFFFLLNCNRDNMEAIRKQQQAEKK